MIFKETILKDCYIITPKVYEDNRGCFFETFNKKEFYKETGINVDFVQDNQSTSSKGVLRGLHFQIGEFAQAKLVRVVQGSVLDVCVDLRNDSKTFGQYVSIKLDSIENTQLFVPRGFAHGFATLEENTVFSYKCDNYYNRESESGIYYDDTKIGIDWQLKENEIILSEKDKKLPSFHEYLQTI